MCQYVQFIICHHAVDALAGAIQQLTKQKLIGIYTEDCDNLSERNTSIEMQ